MSEKELVIEPKVDTSQVHTDLMQLEQTAAMTYKNVLGTVRKGYTTISLLFQVMGATLPIAFQVAAQGVFSAAQAIQILAFSESLTVWQAVQAGLHFAMAALLFYQAFILQQKGSELQSQLQASISLINLYVGGPI